MKKFFLYLIFVVPIILLMNCANDDNITELETSLIFEEYNLNPVDDPSVIGMARILKNEDASITVEIDLSGTPSGGMHPAHIHFNTAAEGGIIAITLGTVNGNTGESSVTFSTLDDGTPITYEELIEFDGYINVHISSTNLDGLLAQGDIGQNELTGVTKTYALNELAVPGISGTAKFSERKNGDALAVIQLLNAISGEMHPAHIHNNTAIESGAIALTFSPINGDTGVSKTNISQLDDATPIAFEDIINFDGYINVHYSATDLGTIIAQGDIGVNELTGESTSYVLNEVDVPGIEGTASFFRRQNGEALAVIELMNTTAGMMHPGHIHMNDVATTGPIIFTFADVDGDTGIGRTNVSQLDDTTPFGYADILEVNGYINIHLSAVDLGTLVAQGNIGANN